MHEESVFLLEAKKIGAHGYISKASSVSEFIDCIQKVLAGNNYYDERLNPSQNKLSEIIHLHLILKFSQVFLLIILGKILLIHFDIKLNSLKGYVSY